MTVWFVLVYYPKTSGNPPPRAGLADGGRGGRIFESVDRVPDFEG
jgi:hypothetical protein